MSMQVAGLYACHLFLDLSLYNFLLFSVVTVGINVHTQCSVVFIWSNSFQHNLRAVLTVDQIQPMICVCLGVIWDYGSLSLMSGPIN